MNVNYSNLLSCCTANLYQIKTATSIVTYTLICGFSAAVYYSDNLMLSNASHSGICMLNVDYSMTLYTSSHGPAHINYLAMILMVTIRNFAL